MKHTDYLSQLENDPEYQQALNELREHFALGDAMIRARIQKGFSQADLAEMVGTKQANISRIESALGNPTLKLIKKIVSALDIQIQFVVPVSSNTFKSVPTPRLRVDNWPTRPVDTSSTSSQSVGNLR